MALETMYEKLQMNEEKNILVQGLPSSIEKQFLKLNFAKSVTPLLKARRIDFALVFAVNKNQLVQILHDVIPALSTTPNFWIAYPKIASKIASDLTRDASWECLKAFNLCAMHQVDLDNVWSAMRFSLIDNKTIASNCTDIVNLLHPIGEAVTKTSVKSMQTKVAPVYFETVSSKRIPKAAIWNAEEASKTLVKPKRVLAAIKELNSVKLLSAAK